MDTIIIAVITFVLGYVTGVYLPMKFRNEDKKPKLSISPFQERQNYFDITNHGGDILNLKITIKWLQDRTEQTRELKEFFNFNEDPAVGYPHNCSALKKGETKKATGCPLYSDNAQISVKVTGNDVDSRKYDETFILANKKK